MSGFALWATWALVGLIAGYMGGRLMSGAKVWLSVLLAVIGGMAGGWLTVGVFGDGEQMVYLSLIGAALLASLGVWIALVAGRRMFPPEDPDE